MLPVCSQHEERNRETSVALTTMHAVQPYVRTRKGRVDAGPLRMCTSAEAARVAAFRMVEFGTALGALAFSRTGDPDFGEFDEPEILATVGEVPGHDSGLPF
jgi:hypothetical protein